MARVADLTESLTSLGIVIERVTTDNERLTVIADNQKRELEQAKRSESDGAQNVADLMAERAAFRTLESALTTSAAMPAGERDVALRERATISEVYKPVLSHFLSHSRQGMPRILLDIRETDTLRGYHSLAAISLICREELPLNVFVLTTGHPDEALAVNVFKFDTGIEILEWDPHTVCTDFSLYLVFAERWPQDSATAAARACSRITLLGLIFPGDTPTAADLLVMNGHDTAAIAEKVRGLLTCDA
jgi:hypothetical protein